MLPPREPRAQRRQEPQALSKSLCSHSGFTKSPQTRKGGLHKGHCLGSRLCAQVLGALKRISWCQRRQNSHTTGEVGCLSLCRHIQFTKCAVICLQLPRVRLRQDPKGSVCCQRSCSQGSCSHRDTMPGATSHTGESGRPPHSHLR